MPEPEPPPDAPAGGHPDTAALAQDWITLWQSELAALAVDREAQESWQRLLALWAQAAAALVAMTTPPPAERSDDGAPRPPAAPRPAPAAAAPDPRDAEIDRLADRVGELERRLSGLVAKP